MHQSEAIRLRLRGLSVFPVSNETKTPLVKWARLQDELPTIEEVKEWFSVNNRSIGVAMGRTSGLLLLDFDFAKHNESKIWYDKNRERLPRTWSERTKSGGLHLYFKWTTALEQKQTNTTSILEKGVDTKGHGGYSKITPSEGYSWINAPHLTPLAVPPDWLVELLPAKGRIIQKAMDGTPNTGEDSWLTKALSNIKDGNRDTTITQIAGSLRARGYSPEDIFAILKGHADKLENGLADLKRICESVGRYSTNAVNEYASDIESFLDHIETVEWLVPNLIARRSIGFVAGLPETMKTWILIDLAVEAARRDMEGSWLGKFFVKNPAKVLYIDQERFKGETQRRFRAVITAKDIRPRDLRGNLYIRCGTTTRIDLQNSFDAFRKELADIRPDIVMIDSFVTFHTRDENNRGDIQEVLERIKQLRNEFGCTFIFIDHENKGAYNARKEEEEPNAFRMAGSIAKPATAEFVLTVRRFSPDTSMVYHTKSTLSNTVAPFNVKVVDMDETKSKIKVEAF